MQSNSQTLTDETEQAVSQVSLRDWGLSGKQGEVFSGIDLDVPRGSVVIIQGAAGSGKTALLLSIAGRMRVTSGEGHVGEHNIREQSRRVREQVSVGHIAGLTDLENDFTLAQHIAERLIMLQPWYKPWVSKSSLREVVDVIRETFESASEVLDRLPEGKFSTSDATHADFLIDDEGKTFVSELSELQKFLLELGLASLAQAPVLVLDNIDYLREREDRARAWAAILIYQELRRNRDPENPLTVIASCEDSSDVDLVLDELRAEVSPTAVDKLSLTPHPRH